MKAKYRRKIARECQACLAPQPPSYGIPDPCLGELPGVANACCGHGVEEGCYVQFVHPPDRTMAEVERDFVLRGESAAAWMRLHGGKPAEFTLSKPEDKPGIGYWTWVGWKKVDRG